MLGDQRADLDVVAVGRAAGAQLRRVARPAGAEVEVLADDDCLGVECAGQQPGAELSRCERRHLLVERQHDELVRAEFRDQAHLLLVGGEEARHPGGIDHREWMPIEGHHCAPQAALTSELDGAADDCPVPGVHAVERPQRERTGARRQ